MEVVPLRFRDLVGIPVQECGEPLVNLLEVAPRVLCTPINADILPYCAEGILVRESVAKKLHLASVKLAQRASSLQVQVVYGYRHPSIQERYHEDMIANVKRRDPFLPEDEMIERVHALIAVPSVAGHPTGGAVDVTIVRDGKPFDMGTPIWDLQSVSLIPTFSPEISNSQLENRLLLREVLTEQDFAPFDGEWWHFSYGDREWAAYYKKPCAIYAPLDLKPLG